MSSSDQEAPRAGKSLPVPAALKLQIRMAIKEHLQEHGDANWDLVRERPEFAPYLGSQSGETGRKRLQRWRSELSRYLPADRTRPHEARDLNEEHRAWAAQTAEAVVASGELIHPPTELALRATGLQAIKIAQLLRLRLEQSHDDITRLWQAAVVANRDGHRGYSAGDPKLLAKVVQLRDQHASLELGVLREANRILEAQEMIDAIVELITSTLAAQPELCNQMLEGFENLRLRMGILDSAA